MELRNLTTHWVALTAFVCLSTQAAVESEAELKAIEKAHAAVAEIKTDFKKAIQEAQKSGDIKKALPGCRITNPHPSKMIVGRTSHKLRNPNNAPPDWTVPYLKKFAKAKPSQIPKHVLVPIEKNRYGYIQPVFVEPICLSCHGSAVDKDVKDAIHELYPNDKAVGFKAGDFRGMVWLEFLE